MLPASEQDFRPAAEEMSLVGGSASLLHDRLSSEEQAPLLISAGRLAPAGPGFGWAAGLHTPLLATSLTKPRSQPKNKFSLAATAAAQR